MAKKDAKKEVKSMVVSRVLVELKLVDKRITKALGESQFVGSCVGKKPVSGFKTNDEFGTLAKASFTSVTDLIKYRQALKDALVKSNATTKVKIGDVEMTVAAAIERKTSIQYEKQLLQRMQYQFTSQQNAVDRKNEEVEQRLDRMLETNFGKDGKADKDAIEAISKPYRENNEAKLVDPLNIKKEIEELSKSIETFEAEVDLALSTSNATTTVEVEV